MSASCPRRAHRQPARGRRRPRLSDAAAPQGAGGRNDLRHPPPRRGVPHRRSRHRDARRPARPHHRRPEMPIAKSSSRPSSADRRTRCSCATRRIVRGRRSSTSTSVVAGTTGPCSFSVARRRGRGARRPGRRRPDATSAAFLVGDVAARERARSDFEGGRMIARPRDASVDLGVGFVSAKRGDRELGGRPVRSARTCSSTRRSPIARRAAGSVLPTSGATLAA